MVVGLVGMPDLKCPALRDEKARQVGQERDGQSRLWNRPNPVDLHPSLDGPGTQSWRSRRHDTNPVTTRDKFFGKALCLALGAALGSRSVLVSYHQDGGLKVACRHSPPR